MHRYRLVPMVAAVCLAATLGAGCSEDSSPTGPEGGSGDNLAYDPNFFVYLRDFRLTVNDVHGLGLDQHIVVGHGGRAFARVPLTSSMVYALLPTGVSNILNGVWASGTDRIIAAGSHIGSEPPVILFFDGESLTPLDHPFDEPLTSVFGLTDPQYYVTGARGSVGFHGPFGWETVFTHPEGRAFWDVWAFDADNVFVVGDGGSIYHYRGGIWATQTTSGEAPHSFDAVWGTSADDVWAVGDGEIWKKVGPVGWQQQFDGGSGLDLVDIHGTDPNHVWAVGNGLVYLEDGSWEVDASFASIRLVAVWADRQRDVTVYGSEGRIYKYDGDAWEFERGDLTGTPYRDIDRVAGEVYTLQDAGGGSWIKRWGPLAMREIIPSEERLSKIWCPSEDEIYGLRPAGEGEIDAYVYHYAENRWSNSWLASANVPMDIWGIDETDVFVACDFGTVYHHDGQFWTPHSAVQPPQNLHGVWGASTRDPMNVFAVGANGTIAHFDGETWTPMISHTTADLRAVWCTPGPEPVTAWAVGDGGVVLRYHGTGLHWTVQPTFVSSDLYAVSGYDAEHVWCAGDRGLVIKHDGEAWRRIRTDMPSVDLRVVWADSEASAWFGGGFNSLCWTGELPAIVLR